VFDDCYRYDNSTSTTITDIYRAFAGIHTALGPYLLATGAAAFESNSSAMTFTDNNTYLLGNDILVAPLLSNASNSRAVTFPGKGNWVNWFTNETYAGGSTATVAAALDEFPVFKRAGSIIVLQGTFAHYSSPFDSTLKSGSAPAFVVAITHPVSGGMACIRRGSGSNRTGFIAEYSHDEQGTTRLSAPKRSSQSVAFVMVSEFYIFVTNFERNLLRQKLNFALQSPVARPVRVYLSSEQQQQQQQQQQNDGVGVLWSHVDSALTVVLADFVDDVYVDWI